MSDRTPPQDLGTERSVIGSIMVNQTALDTAMEMLKEHSFYSTAHRYIFLAIMALVSSSVAVDIITVSDELRKTGHLEECGSEAYLSELVENTVCSPNIAYHCEILLRIQHRRELIETGSWMVDIGFNDKESNSEQLIDSAESRVYSLRTEEGPSKFSNIREILPEVIDDMERVFQIGRAPGLCTGFTRLDKQTTGLQNGDLVIIGGRPSMGKTAFATCVAVNVCKNDPKATVAIFSLEMKKKQLVQRIVAVDCGIEYNRIMSPNLTSAERNRIAISFGRVSELNIEIDDTGLLTPMQQRAKLRRLSRKKNVVLAMCDYLQLMSDSEKHASRNLEIGAITRSQKFIAKEFNIPFVSLSQLSRLSAQRGKDNLPGLADLRESGAIEQDADVVLFCHRPEYYDKDTEKGIAQIIIGKQRNGPTGTVRLAFEKEYMRFSNLSSAEHDSRMTEMSQEF
jgi:replicative DNA helicase